MGAKIMVLCGSPRKKGNTNQLVDWLVEAAKDAGADLEMVDTPRLKYKANGCTACFGCRDSAGFECIVDDEAQPILSRMPEADVIVMATPVYWFAPTAQLKVFADRMFSLVKANPDTGVYSCALAGKKLALISTGGGDLDSGLSIVDQTFSTAARFQNMEYESILIPLAPLDPEDLEKEAELKEKVQAFGRKLAAFGG